MTVSKRTFLSTALASAAVAGLGLRPASVRASPSDEILITNVRVFDGKSDGLSELSKVRIKGELKGL